MDFTCGFSLTEFSCHELPQSWWVGVGVVGRGQLLVVSEDDAGWDGGGFRSEEEKTQLREPNPFKIISEEQKQTIPSL